MLKLKTNKKYFNCGKKEYYAKNYYSNLKKKT